MTCTLRNVYKYPEKHNNDDAIKIMDIIRILKSKCRKIIYSYCVYSCILFKMLYTLCYL